VAVYPGGANDAEPLGTIEGEKTKVNSSIGILVR
jgi:hypothetical protein